MLCLIWRNNSLPVIDVCDRSRIDVYLAIVNIWGLQLFVLILWSNPIRGFRFWVQTQHAEGNVYGFETTCHICLICICSSEFYPLTAVSPLYIYKGGMCTNRHSHGDVCMSRVHKYRQVTAHVSHELHNLCAKGLQNNADVYFCYNIVYHWYTRVFLLATINTNCTNKSW